MTFFFDITTKAKKTNIISTRLFCFHPETQFYVYFKILTLHNQ